MCTNLLYKIVKGPLYNSWGTFTDFQNGNAIFIRCGRCYQCLVFRSLRWQNRLLLESEWRSLHSGFLYFVKKTRLLGKFYGIGDFNNISIALAVLFFSITVYISWCFKTITQKNTTSFSKRTIRSLVIADVLLFVQEFLMIMAINGRENSNPAVGIIAVLILPLVPAITTIFIFIIKFKNAAHAKKHNLTELEYYQKFILPKISSI